MSYNKYREKLLEEIQQVQQDLQDEVEMFTSPMDFVKIALTAEITYIHLRDNVYPGIHFIDYWDKFVTPSLKEYLHPQDIERVRYACYAIAGKLHPQQHNTLTPWMMDQCRYLHETWYPDEEEPPYGLLYDSTGDSVRAQWNH